MSWKKQIRISLRPVSFGYMAPNGTLTLGNGYFHCWANVFNGSTTTTVAIVERHDGAVFFIEPTELAFKQVDKINGKAL